MNNKLIFSVLILVVIVGVIFFLKNTRGKTDFTDKENTSNYVETKANLPGDLIVIPQVILDKPGYVMIHKSENGQTGEIVMTGDYLKKGEHKNVVVRTGITTKPNDRYFAMLHTDDGNQKYDSPSKDSPLVENGAIVQKELVILASFQASFEIITNNLLRSFSKPKYHNLSEYVYIDSIDNSKVIVKKAGITWQDFFDTLPLTLTSDCLISGDGERFCSNQGGVLTFILNGEHNKDALNRFINDGDELVVKFENEN